MVGELEGRVTRDGALELDPGTRRVVGAAGFEPATPCAQGRCATRLRYAPTLKTLDFTLLSNGILIALFAFVAKTVPELSQNYPACPRTPVSLAERFSF